MVSGQGYLSPKQYRAFSGVSRTSIAWWRGRMVTTHPTTYVVDFEGTLQRVFLGPRPYEQFEAEIQRYH